MQGWTGVKIWPWTYPAHKFPHECFFWVIGPSVGVNKLINKTGQKQIMMNITEFKTNAFLSDRNALDNKAMILS